ncbi:MAG: hypothetical protein WAX43_03785 [Lactococcus chungangensis]
MDSVIIKIYSREQHISQILTGFIILKQEGKINNLIIEKHYNAVCNMPNEHIVEVVLNREIIIAYDVHDGYYFYKKEEKAKYDNYIEKVDFYFQRSYNESENKLLNEPDKIFPLGLNYFVSCNNNPLTKIDFQSKNIHDFLASIQRRIAGRNLYVENFEKDPSKTKNIPKIIFITRTWGDRKLDDFRADCIRKLKKEYGSSCVAGFKATKDTLVNYPDCVLPKKITKKSNYLKLMRESDICITTTGLHRSIGWKFAEYIAASKAIVTEKLNYSPGASLKVNENFLEFETSEELIKQVKKLVNNKKLLNNMKVLNSIYYKGYLKPEIIIWNSFKKVLEKF